MRAGWCYQREGLLWGVSFNKDTVCQIHPIIINVLAAKTCLLVFTCEDSKLRKNQQRYLKGDETCHKLVLHTSGSLLSENGINYHLKPSGPAPFLLEGDVQSCSWPRFSLDETASVLFPLMWGFFPFGLLSPTKRANERRKLWPCNLRDTRRGKERNKQRAFAVRSEGNEWIFIAF